MFFFFSSFYLKDTIIRSKDLDKIEIKERVREGGGEREREGRERERERVGRERDSERER